MWLNSIYTDQFDIMKIKVEDIIQCLMHIDQYPMTHLSIDLLEHDLIKYFEKNNICNNAYIKNMVDKYQMKAIYLYFNNIEF